MRRVLIMLTVGALALGLATVTPSPAAAATGTLTVTTLGRDGKPVSTGVQLANRATLRLLEITSGRTARVPRGRYLLLTDVFNDRDGTDTLAARRVTVTAGATRVTIDARHGRPVHVNVTPAEPAGYHHDFLMAVCQLDGPAEVDGYTFGDSLYVIPSRVDDVRLAYAARWLPPRASDAVVVVSGRTNAGLPDGVRRAVPVADLASVTALARRGIETGSASVSLQPAGGDACQSRLGETGTSRSLPFAFRARVSAGTWSVDERSQDYLGTVVTAVAGRRYTVALGKTPWGPAGRLPYTNASRRRIDLDVMQLYAGPDPGGQLADVTYELRHGREVLLRHKGLSDGPEISSRLPGRGWYTVMLSGHRHARFGRYAGDVLCPSASLRLHVYADPSANETVRAFVTRFVPTSLDASNRAPAAGRTTVGLRLLTGRRPDAVRSVQVWASNDGGHSWHRLAVRHTGGRWSVAVHNPAAGFVSLRSTVLDTHGNSATVTVYRAYGIS